MFISVQTGSGSTSRKKNLIVNLMRCCREKEMKFLVRTLVIFLHILLILNVGKQRHPSFFYFLFFFSITFFVFIGISTCK